MSQKAIALGSIAGAAAMGGACAYTRMNTAIDRYPFIAEGLKKASLPVEKIGFWKVAQVDSMNNVGHATVTLADKTVRITARRILTPTMIEKNQKPVDTDIYDDLEGEGSGLAFYWENPWEIKASIKRGFQSAIALAKSYTSSAMEPEEREEENWEVLSVSMDSEPIIGDILSHPFFASQQIKNDSKSPESIRRAKYCLGVLGASAFFVITKRMYLSYRLRPSYVFARDYIQRHPVVSEFYAGGTAEIVARTGEFTRTRIEGEITITGKRITAESVVKFAASRKDAGSQWLVSQALLTPSGSKPIDLLVSRTLI
jgi:hypothetical protein